MTDLIETGLPRNKYIAQIAFASAVRTFPVFGKDLDEALGLFAEAMQNKEVIELELDEGVVAVIDCSQVTNVLICTEAAYAKQQREARLQHMAANGLVTQ